MCQKLKYAAVGGLVMVGLVAGGCGAALLLSPTHAQRDARSAANQALALVDRASADKSGAFTVGRRAYDPASGVLTLTDVAFKPRTGSPIAVDRIELSAIRGGEGKPLVAGKAALHGVAQTSGRDGFANVLKIGEINVANLNLDALAGLAARPGAAQSTAAAFDQVILNDMSVASPFSTVTIGKATVGHLIRKDDKIAGAEWTIADGAVAFPAGSPETAGLQALGYKTLRFGVTGRMNADPGTHDVRVDQTFTAADMGALRVSFDMIAPAKNLPAPPADATEGVTHPLGPSFAAPAATAMMQIMPKLKAFSLVYDDASLVPRLLDAGAKAQNDTRPDLVLGFSAQIESWADKAGPEGRPIADAVVAFLRNPGEISFSIAPDAPQPMFTAFAELARALSNPSDGAVQAIHLRVQEKPPAAHPAAAGR